MSRRNCLKALGRRAECGEDWVDKYISTASLRSFCWLLSSHLVAVMSHVLSNPPGRRWFNPQSVIDRSTVCLQTPN